MKKNNLIFIGHIVESIESIETYLEGMREGDFLASQLAVDAVARRFEIMGEAVKNLDKKFMEKHPEIEWSDIARTRDYLIHHYFGTDAHQLWRTAKKDLPKLYPKFVAILKESESKPS